MKTASLELLLTSGRAGPAGCPPAQTGKLKDGPADLMAGRDVESSDTNPAMDPSEQSKVSKMEGSGTNMAQAQSSGSGGASLGTMFVMDNQHGVGCINAAVALAV
jgi:hypothetical protein